MQTFTKRLGATILAAATVLTLQSGAGAGFIGMPRELSLTAKRISFSNYTLPPMAFTQFCLRYADQCNQKRVVFRGGPLRLTAERWEELKLVNRTINGAITPERNVEGLAGEKWLIGPARGDCNDYAVTKRAELLKRGWPAHSLLLSEVVTSWGEHHLILVVRTSAGDLLLDNLNPNVRPWTKAKYQWVRIQSPKNPNFWALPAAGNA